MAEYDPTEYIEPPPSRPRKKREPDIDEEEERQRHLQQPMRDQIDQLAAARYKAMR